MTEFPRHLRYSPLNHLIVDWSFNGQAFEQCGLPDPLPCEDPSRPKAPPCTPLPIQEAIDTYDWERWLPEVIVGIEDADEEIAASYTREAAIQFARDTRVLQRVVHIPLQPGECTYPVFPYPEERIHGIVAAGFKGQSCACTGGCSGYLPDGVAYSFDPARNEFHLEQGNHDCCDRRYILEVIVWAAPTEDACVHDVFLYEHYRQLITRIARRNYATAVHFRDRRLIQSLSSPLELENDIRLTKTKALMQNSRGVTQRDSGLWGGRSPRRRARW